MNEGALLAARHGAEAVSAALLDEARDKILMGSPRILAQVRRGAVRCSWCRVCGVRCGSAVQCGASGEEFRCLCM